MYLIREDLVVVGVFLHSSLKLLRILPTVLSLSGASSPWLQLTRRKRMVDCGIPLHSRWPFSNRFIFDSSSSNYRTPVVEMAMVLCDSVNAHSRGRFPRSIIFSFFEGAASCGHSAASTFAGHLVIMVSKICATKVYQLIDILQPNSCATTVKKCRNPDWIPCSRVSE